MPLIMLDEFNKFSDLVDQSFANKRKGIKNNLKKLNIDFEELKINPLARAEELSIESFIAIFKTISI
jgi:16S rRNA A1518/A1519 N6-dimethyltransferase RsmA/KsgA/DIM1 with predicted DNA glycosylase/AP lyase activity|tara:strand:- start:330 stop:530 length:201 start_codon:yes stop_codon:yes gene_type:complete